MSTFLPSSMRIPWIAVIAFLLVYVLGQQEAGAIAVPDASPEFMTFLSVGPILIGIVAGYGAQKWVDRFKAK
jgi:hypothetical protein